MAAKPYHHGALKEALLTEALAMLAEHGVHELSLREIARKVGVSATSVYRHYADKDALLRALARQGLEKLAQAQHQAWTDAGGGAAGFDATGVAYVHFALQHPTLFRLIFRHVSPQPPMTLAPDRMSEPMAFLLANAAQLAPPGRDAKTYALQSWALVHGLAMLMLDKQVPPDADLIGDAVKLQPLAGWER